MMKGKYYKDKFAKMFPKAVVPENIKSKSDDLGTKKDSPPGKSLIKKRCKLKNLKRIFKTKASEIAICREYTCKLYFGKYYRQRMIFETPGESFILRKYPSEFFVTVHKVSCNKFRTVEFLEHESLFGECGEWMKMERLLFKASDSGEVEKGGLYPQLLNWLKQLKEFMPNSGIRHRDITLNHIMWSHTFRTFRLIDFAIAVPSEGWKYARDDDPFDDQSMIDGCIERAEREWESAKKK